MQTKFQPENPKEKDPLENLGVDGGGNRPITCRIDLITQYCAGGKIEKNEMGGACGAYGGGERCAQGSSGET